MICNLKHTKFQPTDKQWRCPKCGSEDLVIDDSPNHDCDSLHPDDNVNCYGGCGGGLERQRRSQADRQKDEHGALQALQGARLRAGGEGGQMTTSNLRVRVKYGAVRLCSVDIWHESPDCVVLMVNCNSKYPTAQTVVRIDSRGRRLPYGISLSPGPDTLRIDESRKDKDTEIKLFGLEGDDWFVSCDAEGRYEIQVVCVRIPKVAKLAWIEKKKRLLPQLITTKERK